MTSNELYDMLWEDGIHPFGNPIQFERFMEKLLNNRRKMIKVDRDLKEIHVPDIVSIHDLAVFLMDYPYGEYKILIHEFDENTNTKR